VDGVSYGILLKVRNRNALYTNSWVQLFVLTGCEYWYLVELGRRAEEELFEFQQHNLS